MTALGFLFLSAVLGFTGWLTAPKISEALMTWEWRVGFGIFIFVLVQFGIITPFRMWRASTWVANIEQMLEDLFDWHDKGVELLNAHVEALRINPNLRNEPKPLKVFLDKWYEEFNSWTKDTEAQINKLYPIEARRFKNVVVFSRQFSDGLSDLHDDWRSMLLKRLDRIDAIIARHQPALLPE